MAQYITMGEHPKQRGVQLVKDNETGQYTYFREGTVWVTPDVPWFDTPEAARLAWEFSNPATPDVDAFGRMRIATRYSVGVTDFRGIFGTPSV